MKPSAPSVARATVLRLSIQHLGFGGQTDKRIASDKNHVQHLTVKPRSRVLVRCIWVKGCRAITRLTLPDCARSTPSSGPGRSCLGEWRCVPRADILQRKGAAPY